MAIEKIKHYSMTNSPTVIDEEALTALELAGRTAGKVNELIDSYNDLEKETTDKLAEQDQSIPVKIETAVTKKVEDGTFENIIDEYAGDIIERVQNLESAYQPGDTTANAELYDIRHTANGVSYKTAGEAVRGQYTTLQQRMRGVLQVIKWTEDTMLDAAGDEYGMGGYSVSDYIAVNGAPFEFGTYMGYSARCIMYNKHKKKIEAIAYDTSNSTQGWKTYYPSNKSIYYVRISCVTSIRERAYVALKSAWELDRISDGGVKPNMISAGAVTPEKTCFLTHDENTNLIDRDRIVKGYYINGDTCELTPNSGWGCTDFVPLKPLTNYAWGNFYAGHYAFYDENFNVIESLGASDATHKLANPFKTPARCAYGRFTMLDSNAIATCWIGSESPARYRLKNVVVPSAQNIGDFRVFSKCMCIGDSFMTGTFNVYDEYGQMTYIENPKYSLPRYLQKISNVECVNRSYGGRTIQEWFDEASMNGVFSESGYDCAIIQLGLNNIYNGGWDSSCTYALEDIVTNLMNKNHGIQIFIATLPPAPSYIGDTAKQISRGIRDFVQACHIGNMPNVQLIDLENISRIGDHESYSRGHLTAYGYYILAEDWYNEIGNVIKENPYLANRVELIGDAKYDYNG